MLNNGDQHALARPPNNTSEQSDAVDAKELSNLCVMRIECNMLRPDEPSAISKVLSMLRPSEAGEDGIVLERRSFFTVVRRNIAFYVLSFLEAFLSPVSLSVSLSLSVSSLSLSLSVSLSLSLSLVHSLARSRSCVLVCAVQAAGGGVDNGCTLWASFIVNVPRVVPLLFASFIGVAPCAAANQRRANHR